MVQQFLVSDLYGQTDSTGKTTDFIVDGKNMNLATYTTDSSGNGTGLQGPGGTAGYVDAGFFGASPTATPAVNVAAINTALNKSGNVSLSATGVYQINDSLIIPSDTSFQIGKGVEIKAVTGGPAGVNTFMLLRNTNYNSTPMVVSSISTAVTQGTMLLVTVTFASAHGLAVNGYVQIKGDARELYNGVWKIFTVPSTTTLTFLVSVGNNIVSAPAAALPVASASQTVANPGVFTTAANTYVAGQAVVIAGTAPTGFTTSGATQAAALAAVIAGTATVYYVIATGLTTTAAQLALSPFAASGIQVTGSSACTIVPILQGSAADGNITVGGGGIFNNNVQGGSFTTTNTPGANCIVLRRVLSPLIDGLTIRDNGQHSMVIQDTLNPVVRNIKLYTPMDGVHIYGPTWNPLIENVTGDVGNDAAIFQTVDQSPYTPLMVGVGFDLGGDIFNGTMRDIRPNAAHNTGAVAIYPNGNTGAAGQTNAIYRIRGKVLVDGASVKYPTNVNGTTNPCNVVGVGNSYVSVSGTLDTLELRNTYGVIRLNNSGSGTGAVVTIGEVLITGASGDSFYGDSTATNIDFTNIRNMYFSGCNMHTSTGGGLVTLGSSNAVVGSVVFNGCNFDSTGASGTVLGLASSGATMYSATAIGCFFGTNSSFLGAATFANVPQINVIGCSGSGYKNLIECSNTQSYVININGFNSVSPAVGLFNFYGSGTYTFSITGLTYTGTLFANQLGTYNWTNPDGSFPIDLSKLARTAGSIAKSIGNGTIVANNLAVCDATGVANSWKQLSNTALVY